MTENKRFKLKYINEQHISANLYYDETFIGSIGIGGELIVESLNNLSEENEQLKKELQRMYDVATLNKVIEVLEKKYDKMLSDGSDEIKDAMRHTVLRCIEDLDELKDNITAR